MSNYKIRVNSKAESKEVQELFFELDYNWFKKGYMEVKTPETIMSFENGALTTGIRGSISHKEITLPELRDLVVLKRNDVGDATHTDGRYSFYVGKDENYFFSGCDKAWRGTWKNVEILKPIEKKEMKEYLIKSGDGKYLLTHHDSIGAIEIPEGAESFNYFGNEGNVFFLKNNSEITLYSNETEDWAWQDWGDIDFDGVVCLWKRETLNDQAASADQHTHPEELPFIDDEPKIETATGYQLDVVGSNTYGARSRDTGESDIYYRQYLMNFIVGNRTKSLNDQYAEIEKVRQSAWQKQEGGNHYKNLKIQPMQYALENKLDYAQANVVKYVTRHKEKNGKEDLLKAIHNIELMIEFYYGGGE